MSYLPQVLGVYDENGDRVDPKRSDGTYGPIFLKLGKGILATAEVKGGITEVTITDRSAVNVTDVKTADYTAAAADFVVCDPSGGPFTVYLPSLDDVPAGTQIAVWNGTTSTNKITVNPDGSEFINGADVAEIESSYDMVVLTAAVVPGGKMWAKG